MVIQYSLHILVHPAAPLAHACYLSADRNEPVVHLIAHLKNTFILLMGQLLFGMQALRK